MMRERVLHELKTWPPFFEDIKQGRKTFEYRKDDRDFQVGDTLLLREYEPLTQRYTYRELKAVIIYILHGDTVPLAFGISPDCCIMSIAVVK